MTKWIRMAEKHDLEAFRRPLRAPPSGLAPALAKGVQQADGPFTAYARLLEDGGDGVGDGVWRHPDGTLTVACTIAMPGVTAEMWDWWFGWHGLTNERYRLWHPDAHIASALAFDPRERPAGKPRYVNNFSAVDEYIGDEMTKLVIGFLPPREYGFDEQALAERGTAICGRSWLRGTGLQVGELCHFVADGTGGAVMHSRFHLGNITCEWPVLGLAVTPLLNIPAVRRKLQNDGFGLALLQHCFEEMNHLAGILPGLYSRFGED